jgi:hypothetical protein
VDITRKTEALGQSVSQGLITREAAIQELVEFSDGGITRVGAADMIDNWQGVRGKYVKAMDDARDRIRKLK